MLRACWQTCRALDLVRETFDLLRAARAMEQAHPPHGRGVTEFNHFFQAAYQAVRRKRRRFRRPAGRRNRPAKTNWSPCWNG